MNIIELAKRAGFSVKNFKPPAITAQHSNGSWIGINEELERFAALVRAAAMEEAADEADRWQTSLYDPRYKCDCAAAIRALKE